MLLLLGGVVVAVVVCLTVAWLVLAAGDHEITETLVSQRDLVSREPRVYEVPCSEDYDNYQRYPGVCHLCKRDADSLARRCVNTSATNRCTVCIQCIRCVTV